MSQDVWDQVDHRYADSSGVKIHYAALGEGPLAVMIHGFPDFWYSWRDQMQALARASGSLTHSASRSAESAL